MKHLLAVVDRCTLHAVTQLCAVDVAVIKVSVPAFPFPQAWLRTMDTTMLQLTVQSGCAHLILDLLVGAGGTSGEAGGGAGSDGVADGGEAAPTDAGSMVASGTAFAALKRPPPPQQQQQQPTVNTLLDTNTGSSLVSASDLGPPLSYALASGSSSGLHTPQASRDVGISTASSLSLDPTATAPANTHPMEQQRLLLQQVHLPDMAPADTGGVVWERLTDGGLQEVLLALRGGGGGGGGGGQGPSAAGDGRSGAGSPMGNSGTQRVLLQLEDKVSSGCTAAGPHLALL